MVAKTKERKRTRAAPRREVKARPIQVDQGGACRRKRFHRRLKRVQHRLGRRDERVESPQPYACHAEPCALEAVFVHELGVVGGDVRGTSLARSLPAQRHATRCWVAPVQAAALNDTQRCCRIRYPPSGRTPRPLLARAWPYARAPGNPAPPL